MADVSNNTKKLQELAKALGDTDFDHEVNPRIKALKIEDIAFPLFSGLGDSYEQTRQSAEDAAKALGEVLKALGAPSSPSPTTTSGWKSSTGRTSTPLTPS